LVVKLGYPPSGGGTTARAFGQITTIATTNRARMDRIGVLLETALQRNSSIVEIESRSLFNVYYSTYTELQKSLSVRSSFDCSGCYRSDRRTTAVSVGKIHCAGVAVITAPVPPYRRESLVQSASHRQFCGGASKGSEAGCKTWRSPKFTNSKRSSLPSEKYRSTKLVRPSTAPSIPPEFCR